MGQAGKLLLDFFQLSCHLFLILLQTFFGLCDRGNQIKSGTCAATVTASCSGAATTNAILKLRILFQFYSYKAINFLFAILSYNDIAFVAFFVFIIDPEFCPLAAAQGDGFSLVADRIGHAGLHTSIQHVQDGVILVNNLYPAGCSANADYHG